MEKKIIFLLSILLIFIHLNVYAVDSTIEEQVQAVIATASAYERQGNQIQYDSYRKNFYATPEDATSQHNVYTVCSGFAFQTYYQTLGIELPYDTATLLDYAKANKDNSNVILFYYGSKDEVYSENILGTTDSPNYGEFEKYMSEYAKPGDLFVVTRSCNDGRKC